MLYGGPSARQKSPKEAWRNGVRPVAVGVRCGPDSDPPRKSRRRRRRIVGRWLISNYSNIHHSTRIDPDFEYGRIGAAAAAAICMTHHQAPISLWAGKRYPSGTTRPPSVISSCPSVFSVPGNRLQLRLETFQYRNRSHVEVSTGAWVSVYLETLGRIWVSSSDRYKRQTERDKVMKDSQQVRCMALRMNVNMVLSSALLVSHLFFITYACVLVVSDIHRYFSEMNRST